ncbi:MAG: hypothetical protein ACTS73_09195 [Arsenophonus sp. NEOnobi-MAG3]
MQPKVKAELREVWLPDSRDTINNALDVLLRKFSVKISCSYEGRW